jgi:hypothetical protein
MHPLIQKVKSGFLLHQLALHKNTISLVNDPSTDGTFEIERLEAKSSSNHISINICGD